jgi:predicted DCC family thiol-disulfide oxidoreductase YuxK
MGKDTLYYDDNCPICRAEMARLAKHHGDGLELLPISSLPVKDQSVLRSELHLKTEDGKWVKGLDANVRAWQHTRYGNLANLLLHPAFRWLAELGYQTWLLWYQFARKRREDDS